jgi:hypothetical protein
LLDGERGLRDPRLRQPLRESIRSSFHAGPSLEKIQSVVYSVVSES